MEKRETSELKRAKIEVGLVMRIIGWRKDE